MQHLLSIGSHMSRILLVGKSPFDVNLFVDIRVHTSEFEIHGFERIHFKVKRHFTNLQDICIHLMKITSSICV
jgi:hypothetical protein